MSDDFNEVYIAPEEYVKVGMKQLTAKRMADWLKSYAEYETVAGNTKTAEHAEAIAERIDYQLQQIDE